MKRAEKFAKLNSQREVPINFPALQIPVEDLDISVRSYNQLKDCGFITLAHVVVCSPNDLFVKGVGTKAVWDVAEQLGTQYNLALGMIIVAAPPKISPWEDSVGALRRAQGHLIHDNPAAREPTFQPGTLWDVRCACRVLEACATIAGYLRSGGLTKQK